jgi:protein-L-isoaspartate(D-aspartate) O-methyltransferase
MDKFHDSYVHKGLRKKLIQILRTKGISDENVLQAMSEIPRQYFVAAGLDRVVYEDRAIPIDADQTISQPYTVAFMSQLLKIEKRDKVLELGTGSGYQAIVLAKLGASVYTVERQEALFVKTSRLLKEMGFTGIRTFLRDGSNGLSNQAPFDKIIVTAALDEVPQALLEQLRTGGYLIAPVGQPIQELQLILKNAEDNFTIVRHGDFRFVPVLSGIQRDSHN